jgi:hypothetical protein
MATLSTTAWVLHDLGLAAGFGGNLFGQMALSPAVRSIESKRERGKVTHVAWSRFKAVNAVALAAMAGTWLIGRTVLSGRAVGHGAQPLVVAKDIIVCGALASGIGAMVFGSMLDREQEGAPAIESGAEAAPETPERTARLQRATNTLGRISMLLNAGVLAITTVLAMKAGESQRWSVLSRVLP